MNNNYYIDLLTKKVEELEKRISTLERYIVWKLDNTLGDLDD